MYRKDSPNRKAGTTISSDMATRPTVLYPDRSSPTEKRAKAPTLGADASAFRSVDIDAMLPEDHLLALREGVDYLSGILLLLNEHLQQSAGMGRDNDSISAVSEHALSRARELRGHLDALTDDHLQRMRASRP